MMSLINPAILYGLGLALIPVVLHFLMRTKPKKLLFPALRLIQVRRKTNVRRMRLRHIWLLLLRIAAIVLLVLALTRPSLPAANYSLTLRETITLAAVVAAAIGIYAGVLHTWRRRRVPNHTLTYRRSILRGGTAIGTIVLLLLLVAWPYQRRIAAEITAPLPDVAQNFPVAGVFLFDTSMSMEYRLENKTRLDVAKEIAAEHLSRLPAQSRIAVASTAADSPILFQADLAGARNRLDSLKCSPLSFPVNDRLRTAVLLQEEDFERTRDLQTSVPNELRRDLYLREIYLFTDLAQSGWRMSAAKQLRDELARLPWVQVYLIDVGVEQPTNVAITSLTLSKQTLPLGGELIVDAVIEATGVKEADRTVELTIQNGAANPVKQGKSTVKVSAEAGARVSFPVHGLTGPISRGEVRLVASDPLAADDVRYFTVEVRPPPEVLVVAERRSDANYLMEALAPSGLVRLGKSRYRASFSTAAKLANTNLARFDVVCLVNLTAPSNEDWNKLAQFVQNGGGLAVFAGSTQINPVAYNREAAQSCLPAELLGHVGFRPPEFIDARNLTHPILNRFDTLGGTGELTSVEIRRCWSVQPNAGASVIARYSDSRKLPALVERSHGDGRIVMLTTAVDSTDWNDLPRSWSFLALADQMMQYLGRRAEAVFNYTAGDEVLLRLDPTKPIKRYLLSKPGFEQLPGEVPPGAHTVTLRDADQLGHYEVKGLEATPPFTAGFSVNLPPGESDFTRLREADLDLLLGEGRYRIARQIDELERFVSEGRIGQEVFSIALFVMMLAFCAELVVANRFYEADQAAEHAGKRGTKIEDRG